MKENNQIGKLSDRMSTSSWRSWIWALSSSNYREKEVLSVPGSAVFRSDGRDFVFRLIGNRAVKTEVNVSYKSNTVYVIKEGLSEGELVIRDADLEGLSDGRRCHAV